MSGKPAPTGVGRYLGCSCKHNATKHRHASCTGRDSYNCPCACPSFELSQECAEFLQPDEVAPMRAYLSARGFEVGPNADLLCRYTR